MKKNIKVLFLITICLFFANMEVVSASEKSKEVTTRCGVSTAPTICNASNSDNERFNIKVCLDENKKISKMFYTYVFPGGEAMKYFPSRDLFSTITVGSNYAGTLTGDMVNYVYFSEKALNNINKMIEEIDSNDEYDFSRSNSKCPSSIYVKKSKKRAFPGYFCIQTNGENYCDSDELGIDWPKKNTTIFDINLEDAYDPKNTPDYVVPNVSEYNPTLGGQLSKTFKNFEISESTCESLLGLPNDTSDPAYYVNLGFTWIKYIAIIILILYSMKDFAFAIISKDEESIKKATGVCVKRLIYCIIIFLLPVLIEIVMEWANIVSDPSCGLG